MEALSRVVRVTPPFFSIIRDQPFKSFGGSLFNKISRNGYLCDTIWMWNNNSGTSFFIHLTSSQRKRKSNTHQNNHLYCKIGFFFLDFNTDFCHCWKLELHKVLIFYPCKTDYCFIKSVAWNEKEIAPLVKWSLRLPYTFLSVGSPFIEEGGKMP
jgi:hypothetical protein